MPVAARATRKVMMRPWQTRAGLGGRLQRWGSAPWVKTQARSISAQSAMFGSAARRCCKLLYQHLRSVSTVSLFLVLLYTCALSGNQTACLPAQPSMLVSTHSDSLFAARGHLRVRAKALGGHTSKSLKHRKLLSAANAATKRELGNVSNGAGKGDATLPELASPGQSTQNRKPARPGRVYVCEE